METEVLPNKKKRRKKNVVERKNTNLSDGALAEKSRAWQVLFTQNMAAFEGFDPDLNAAFLSQWRGLTVQFEEQETDETALDVVGIATRQVSHQLAAVTDLAGSLEYFAKKAFAAKGRTLMQFGFDKLTTPLSTGISRFVFYCFATNKVVKDFEAALLAAGMPAALPANFLTAVELLAAAEVDLEYQKRLRLRSTEQRIDLFNTLYDHCTKVHKAAQVVFFSQPAIKQQFDW